MLVYITYLIYISTINTKHLRTFFLLFQDVKESFKMIQVTEITLKTLKKIELKKNFIGNFLCKNLNTNSKLLKTQRCAQQQHVTPSCCHRGRTDNGQKARYADKEASTYLHVSQCAYVCRPVVSVTFRTDYCQKCLCPDSYLLPTLGPYSKDNQRYSSCLHLICP